MNDDMWEGRFYCFCGAKLEIDAPPHVVCQITYVGLTSDGFTAIDKDTPEEIVFHD